jgi:hypothetical protein
MLQPAAVFKPLKPKAKMKWRPPKRSSSSSTQISAMQKVNADGDGESDVPKKMKLTRPCDGLDDPDVRATAEAEEPDVHEDPDVHAANRVHRESDLAVMCVPDTAAGDDDGCFFVTYGELRSVALAAAAAGDGDAPSFDPGAEVEGAGGADAEASKATFDPGAEVEGADGADAIASEATQSPATLLPRERRQRLVKALLLRMSRKRK